VNIRWPFYKWLKLNWTGPEFQNEVEMVNSEHDKNRQDDVWRANQVPIRQNFTSL
jgi:hypothetical protein